MFLRKESLFLTPLLSLLLVYNNKLLLYNNKNLLFLLQNRATCLQNLRVHGLEEIARWAERPVLLNSLIANEAVRNQFFRNIFLVGGEESEEEDNVIEKDIIYSDEQNLLIFGLHDNVWL